VKIRTLLAAAMAAACCSSATAIRAAPAAAPARPPACREPEFRQFDFWVGHWTVEDVLNHTPGESVIEAVYGGCGIRENWIEPGLTGGSLNIFVPAEGKWRQLWIDSSGSRREFIGGLNDKGEMVLVATYPSRAQPGKTVMDRMIFSKRPDGTVRQYSDASLDGGATWVARYDNIYTRRD
jgi:hypothetical protein